MKKRPTNKSGLVLRTTPDMGNWLHPQTAERKRIIKERALEAVNRYLRRRYANKDFIVCVVNLRRASRKIRRLINKQLDRYYKLRVSTLLAGRIKENHDKLDLYNLSLRIML